MRRFTQLYRNFDQFGFCGGIRMQMFTYACLCHRYGKTNVPEFIPEK